jgi:hypothetical protein
MPRSLIRCAQAELAARYFKGLAELTVEPGANRRLVVLVEFLPIERVENFDEGVACRTMLQGLDATPKRTEGQPVSRSFG